MTLIPLDRKELILADAKERILKNHTLEQIAKTHGITKRTLNTWLMSLGDEYQELRQLCIDNMLAEALEEIDNSDSNFPLARELKVESSYLVCRKKRSAAVWR
jgi:transposase-like protein